MKYKKPKFKILFKKFLRNDDDDILGLSSFGVSFTKFDSKDKSVRVEVCDDSRCTDICFGMKDKKFLLGFAKALTKAAKKL